MLDRISYLIKISAFLLLVSLIATGCGASGPTVEEAVAQTVEAQAALALQVQQTVDAQLASLAPAAPDITDPASGIQSVLSAPNPNVANGTPQLRVNLSSVNVRSGPGTNYRAFSGLLLNSVVTVIAKNSNGSWFLIQLPNGELGWIADSVTDPVVPADMVAVQVAVTIPAPPVAPVAPAATAIPATVASVATTTVVATMAVVATNTVAATMPAQATATATATQPVPVQSLTKITVVNNSTIEICVINIDLSVDPWTVDRLGPNTLQSGFQIEFDFPTGEYDFQAFDCSNVIVADLDDMLVLSPFTWNIP